MPIQHGKNETIQKFEGGYFSVLNYRGKTNDTEESYTEILADYVLKNLSILDKPIITRKSSYKVHSEEHKKGMNPNDTKRDEEILARKLFNKIDKMIDIQVPLKNKQNNYGVGKIDLLYEDGKNLFICELKRKKSKETLLRAVVEIYQYSMMLDTEKLKKDFEKENHDIKCAVLIVEGSPLHEEYKCKEPNITALIKKLEIEIFFVDDKKFEIKKLR